MGTETAICVSGNKRIPKHIGKYISNIGTIDYNPALQLSFSDRMHLPGIETTDRCILLPFLVETYAKTELLQKERKICSNRVCGRRKVPKESIGSNTRD